MSPDSPYTKRVELIKKAELDPVEIAYMTEAERFSDAVLTEAGKDLARPYVTDVEGPVYALTERLPAVLGAAALARLSRRGDDLRVTLVDEFLQYLKPDELQDAQVEDFVSRCMDAYTEMASQEGEENGLLSDTHTSRRFFTEVAKIHAALSNGDEEETERGLLKARMLINRVVNDFGDDSVKQLVYGTVVYEWASNLLTKKLEHGRLQAYLEQSSRYIYFDQLTPEGRFKYHIPEGLNGSGRETFISSMDDIFANYSAVVKGIRRHLVDHDDTPQSQRDLAWKAAIRGRACDAARLLLPVSTATTVGIVGSGQALENMIINLHAGETIEESRAGSAILEQVRRVIPVFFDTTDRPDRGSAISAYLSRTRQDIRELGRERLPVAYETISSGPRLAEVSDADDLQALLPHILYPVARGLDLQQLADIVATMPQEEKEAIFWRYVGDRSNRRQKPGRALEHLSYSWDMVCDYGIFRDLHRHRMVNNFEWQLLTPFHGYEMPALVLDAGYEDIYRQTFERSRQLYEDLIIKHGVGPVEAQYATLFGHRMRWKWDINARQAFHLCELRTQPAGHPGYRKLVAQMHAQIAQVHPHIATAMKFVNPDVEATSRLESTRRAAEKAKRLGAKMLGQED